MNQYVIGEIVCLTVSKLDDESAHLVDTSGSRPHVQVRTSEISWELKGWRPEDYLKIGDRTEVLILRPGEEGGWIGSIRRLDSTGNPYRRLLSVPAGTRLEATAEFVLPNAITLALTIDRTLNVLTLSNPGGIVPGQTVFVTLDQVDVECGKVLVTLLPDQPETSPRT